MGRLLALGAGMLALATLVPAAWSQETTTPEDPMAQALTAVRSPASAKMLELQDARQYLVDQRQVSRPLVVQLLSNADTLVRMNAAIILSNMASAGDTSAATLQALQTAATDKELAVAYWGFHGLMSDGVPAADQGTVISEMMKMERPRALRLAALTTIDDKKPKPAAPIIVSHLQEILKEYKAQVETVVTSAETIRRVGSGYLTGPAGGVPRLTYAPSQSSQPTGPGRAGMPGGVTPRTRGAIPGLPGEMGMPGGGRGEMMPGGGRGGMPPPPGGGWPGGLPGEVPGLGLRTPGAGTGMEPSRPEMPAVQLEQVRRADLPDMTLDQLQAYAQGMEAMPIVAEVHEMGLVLEDIVANSSPDAPLFDFKTTPPWDLDKCVDKAVIYMNSHRAEYGPAPEPPKPSAPAPEVSSQAAPTTGTAPATTAAIPASTTPAPAAKAPSEAAPATGTTPATTAATPAGTTPAQ